MAKVIGVHGVGHEFSGQDTLHKEWLPALKDGLALANRGLASDDDFACTFYGKLFRPAGKAAGDPPFDASDVAEDWRRELLELWWREAARTDDEVSGSLDGAMGALVTSEHATHATVRSVALVALDGRPVVVLGGQEQR